MAKQSLFYTAVAIFAIFIGSQITEGALLLPHWQSLSPNDFYAYYGEFGPVIGRFYTILTIIAALIPFALSAYAKATRSNALKYSLTSAFLAILFVSSFYVYFKGTNELFLQAALTDSELKSELITWGNWHWGRILVECLSLAFLILAFVKLQNKDNQ